MPRVGIANIRPQSHTARARRKGLTLIELLLAVTITGLIGGGVVAMMVAVAYGTSSSRDLRSLVVKSATIDGRLGAAIRSSRQVLAVGTDYCILWAADDDDDSATDNAEVRLIERDPTTDELNSYANAGAAGGYVNAATFRSAAKASYPVELWGTGVTAVSFATDAAPPATALVSYSFTLQDADLPESVVGAAALRN